MPTMTVMRGLPGSGKSTNATWIAGLASNTMRVSRDDLRLTLFNETGILAPEKEDLITKIQRYQVSKAMTAGMDVIVDDMNLRHSYVRDWHKLAVDHGADFKTHTFGTPIDTCVQRDAARDRVVGEKVIRMLAEKFCDKDGVPKPYDISQDPYENSEKKAKPVFKKVVQNPTKRHVVLVDIDGTMAKNTSGRGWFDWSRVGEDSPNRHIVELVMTLLKAGREVIFLSGRSDICRDETVMWLRRHLSARHDKQWTVVMRKDGDNRSDDIVKREIFDEQIAPLYYVDFVLDDRPKVVRMWAASGIPVLDVDPTGPEF